MKISVKTKAEEMGVNLDLLSSAAQEAFKTAIGHIAVQAKDEWIRRAGARGVNQEYIFGLQKRESYMSRDRGSETVYTISLIGQLPNMLEFGFPRFDMKQVKPGWLWGGKAKTSAKGKQYVTIPFRHPTGQRRNIRYSGKAKAAGLQQKVQEVRKKYGLDRMRRAGGLVIEGAVRRVPKGAPVHPYLQGLTRVQKANPGGKTGSAQIMTWRTMSETSDPSSWVHPGYEGVKLMPEIEKFIEQELEKQIKVLMRGL